MADDLLTEKAKLLGSLLLFTRVMYKLRTGREFIISNPVSNEPHVITICRELTSVFNLNTLYQIINVPPGWGKSELCKHFVAWALAHYPDSNFLYISYGHDLAAKHTQGIKHILEIPLYQSLFGVQITQDTSAKDYFKTNQGGVVAAFGSGGAITGHDAGLPNLNRFSGCIIMDDMHKPDQVHSDTIRESTTRNYFETIRPRKRGILVPNIFIGQRLHEDDLPAHLIAGKDGNTWDACIIQALDVHGNARYPEIHPKEMLLNEEKTNPYVFASQYQQNPIPAGGGIFKPEWFVLLDDEPDIKATFITCDTAETSKDYNDATVFSFWGLYRVREAYVDLDVWAIHWIDCIEIRVEPKDLEPNFRQFYNNCLYHKVKPQLAAIEKKSSGATLISILENLRGLQILDIQRTRSSGSKADRFLEAQPYVARHLISLPKNGIHTQMCIEHCKRITANNSHKFDDIADTLYDAINIGLITENISRTLVIQDDTNVVKEFATQNLMLQRLRKNAYGQNIR